MIFSRSNSRLSNGLRSSLTQDLGALRKRGKNEELLKEPSNPKLNLQVKQNAPKLQIYNSHQSSNEEGGLQNSSRRSEEEASIQ
jgi:hypothetical protein